MSDATIVGLRTLVGVLILISGSFAFEFLAQGYVLPGWGLAVSALVGATWSHFVGVWALATYRRSMVDA